MTDMTEVTAQKCRTFLLQEAKDVDRKISGGRQRKKDQKIEKKSSKNSTIEPFPSGPTEKT